MEKGNIVVTIKWNKQSYELALGSNESLDMLRARIYSVTNVIAEKQKLLFKGKNLKDGDSTLEANGLADEILPVGLVNLGNTCYLNSTLQIFHRLPELKSFLEHLKTDKARDSGERLLFALKHIDKRLETAGEAFQPVEFLQVFFSTFPQFAEREEGHGVYKQQDADEVFQMILNSVEPYVEGGQLAGNQNLITKLFEVATRAVFINKETGEQEGEAVVDRSKKLSCIIDNQMNPVNNLSEGIRVALEETIEKNSEALSRNCLFSKKQELLNLPNYLVVQKIRFVWREKDIGTNTEARKAKILRNVAFPRILDVFEFCTPELKTSLQPVRELEIQRSEAEKKASQEAYENYKKANNREGEDNFKLYKKFREDQNLKDQALHDNRLWGDLDQSRPTGNYELVGVITHKGRSSESGHYVAWTQFKGDSWLRYDDDEVSKVTIEDVLNLRGGGDWHMAYYLIYRRLDFGL